MAELERSLAVFIDFENLALGFQGRRERFDIARVLERLVEKGKIVVKKAYADWIRFSTFTPILHEAAIELIEIPQRRQTGKNSADIRLCVDAMDLAYSKDHIDTFVVVSGDSDFSPLVSKLKELGKHVIGLGMQESTSELLRDNCDEFIYYEDLGQETTIAPTIVSHLSEAKKKAFALLLESLQALRRENKDVLWSSMIKDTIKRKKPSFNETYHGYRTFSEMLEDAQKEGLLELETDKRSRTYVVRRFGNELHHDGPVVATEEGSELPTPAVAGEAGTDGGVRKKSRRRRRRGGQGVGNGNGSYPQNTPIPAGPAGPVAVPREVAPREAAPPPAPAAATPSPAAPRPAPPPPVRREPPRAPVAPPPVRQPVRQPVGFDAGLDFHTDEPAPPPPPAAKASPPPPSPRPAVEPEAAPAPPARRSRARTPKPPAEKAAPKAPKAPARGRSRKKAGPEAKAAAPETPAGEGPGAS